MTCFDGPPALLCSKHEREGAVSFPLTPIPLPHSKCDTEGGCVLPTHPCPFPCSKSEMEGVSSFPTHHHPPPSLKIQDGVEFPPSNPPLFPSLAQSTRQRGAFMCFDPLPSPPSLESQDRGVSSFPIHHHPLSCSKCEMEGAFVDPPLFLLLTQIAFQPATIPSLT